MIRYKIYQNQQKKGVNAGKWFARAVSDETYDLGKLAEHMSKHNSPYSGGVIKFSLEKNITGMRLRARATGNLSTTNLKLDSQLKQQAEYQKPTASGGGSDSGNTPDTNPDDNGGEAPDPAE